MTTPKDSEHVKVKPEIKTKLSTLAPKADPKLKAFTKVEKEARKASKSDLIPAKKKQRIVALVFNPPQEC